MTAPAISRKQLVASLIRDIPDFPKPGVMFKDITPLIASAHGLRACVSEFADLANGGVDIVVGMEARGFIFAAPLALELNAGFVPVRKPGKLPGDVLSETFALEYGTETLNIHADAVHPGSRVLVVDDVLATGGTIKATVDLLNRLGAEVVHIGVVVELGFLGGRQRLESQGIDNCSAILTV